MKYVIIGGDAAGMSAAMQIKRGGNEQNEIITLERGEYYSYGQCGLPYVLSGQVESTDDVIARPVKVFREKYGIDARINHEVTHIDHENKSVSGLQTETGEPFQVEYDQLLIATGVSPVQPDWEGINLGGIMSMKYIPDTEAIKAYINQHQPKTVTIVGGGFIGLELAENIEEIGINVRIIQRGNQLMNPFDEDMAELIKDEAKEKGVELVFSESVQSFKGQEHVDTVVTDKNEYETDMVLINVGVKPNTEMVSDDFHLGPKGEMIVNAYMETNIDDVYAAGDCASHYHRVKQLNDFVPLGTTANKQGMIAGMNMVGQHRAFQGIVGTSILKFFDLDIGRTGLSEKEAKQLNIPSDTVKVETNAIAGYYEKGQHVTVKIVFDQNSKRLLGGQVIGVMGIDKRIDVLATALYHNMTTEDLLNLDLAYAPPYNGVWDPIQQAARRTL
ncbi:NADPH-dependent 2,4-dienoyl-CoA reductase/sulfur reductase-like enzyme [Alkalibacillus filiformis]|uniref:NADPH-dependent 2,4-dienoyl-CoA reductase/sulfur reductase-like enzyme n=1 Tax=Alkalibacillus filiformis TaxID=200990 RepID=A0ABU0DQ32_9BACI|nr:FAD-dependent oxidoreductase [Alkalibacillus filiformis]MDQ0350439.1 NADPH-dependent 2,4-dienoyl-CoA reductase/sulfur reductase-like enzyme [Alkalibacillus filiformis]